MQYQQAILVLTFVLFAVIFVYLRYKPKLFRVVLVTTTIAYLLAAIFPYLLLLLSLKEIIILYDIVILLSVFVIEKAFFEEQKMHMATEVSDSNELLIDGQNIVNNGAEIDSSAMSKYATDTGINENNHGKTGTDLVSNDEAELIEQAATLDAQQSELVGLFAIEPKNNAENKALSVEDLKMIDEAVAEIFADESYLLPVASGLDDQQKTIAAPSTAADDEESIRPQTKLRTQEQLDQFIIAAFDAKSKADYHGAIRELEQLLALDPPGDMACLVFDELEVLYKKVMH